MTHVVFPVLAATHQVNRVAALAVSAADDHVWEGVHGPDCAQCTALGAALARHDIPVLGAHKGYTTTHQVIADVRQFGDGLEVTQRLARANIITSEVPLS